MKQELIKQTFKLGNSSAVLLPKKWQNKKVRVELIEDAILEDVISILKEKNLLKNTKGIYLVGSYARGDYDSESDIDILVISDKMSGIINKK